MSEDDKKSYSVPKPSEVPEDPTLREFHDQAMKKREEQWAWAIENERGLFDDWLAENPDAGPDDHKAYFDYVGKLHEERQKLLSELRRPAAIEDARREIFDLSAQMTEEDYSYDQEIREALQTIHFLVGETFDGSMGDESFDFALEEIKVQEAIIEAAMLSRSKSPGDIWARYPVARKRLLQAQLDLRDGGQDTIQQRVLEIEAKLPTYNLMKPKSPGLEKRRHPKYENMNPNWIFSWGEWNEAVRRVEYFNRGNTDGLPDASAEPWLWDDEDWEKWFEDDMDGPPEGLFNDPIEDLHHDIQRLNEQVQWLKIELSRDNRISGEYREESEATIASQKSTIINYNADRFRPKNGWHPTMEENIEILQKMGMEGHSVEVLFNRRDPHVQRNLMARWGIDIGYATRMNFKVTHYSHMNNFYGQLENHPNTTVLLGLNIDRRNKLHVKTTLRPLHEGDKWQYLEHKHLPGGIGFSKYTKHDLLAAHRKMVAELYGKKGPRD